MPRDISFFAAGEGSEQTADYLLGLAAGADDSDAMDEDTVAGPSEFDSPSRPESSLYGTLVAVFVGPARREFLIHPELLCNVSRHMADMLSGAAKEREMKRVHYSRHKLQKMLFPQGKQPGAKQLSAADVLLKKLEGLGELHGSNILETRIHKLLKAGLKSSDIPSLDQWRIKKRMHLLLTTYERCLQDLAATEEPAADDSEPSLSFPHASVAAFENFSHWLYHKTLTSPNRSHNGTWEPLTPEELVELYTLADYLRVYTLQNLITDTLESISPNTDGFKHMILHVSANPSRDSALLRLLVRMYAQHATSADMRRAVGGWMPQGFHVELTALLLEDAARNKGKAPAYGTSRCEYHVHNKVNPRCP